MRENVCDWASLKNISGQVSNSKYNLFPVV